ncbi:phosphate ABC transporter substrate-binding protein PstS [Corynebacterium sp. 13CS0277]|uniref:phosphate ABC transporter substrate-binding protein PstS n=1 Tax=Corynebacterium sp. 13CS0277 TaxID=2071994 RepID=UPI000D041607|nr:phosphate ABC transporter substrate-binding protein PstS [Corynebacterium sp. 13CS0277]PRQ11311.1 phosphate ABC transporter substrate-binding protein PstS [Corynebacterium sp. 13CS0277]
MTLTPTILRSRRIVALAALGLGLVACSDGAGGEQAALPAEAAEKLSGQAGTLVAEGASSQQKAMDIFGTAYAAAVDGATLSYTPSGSGAGQKQFIAGQVAFGGSDSPLKEEQLAAAAARCGGNEAWHLPMVIGPVAVAYNLPGVEQVTLTPAVIADIFSGKVTSWNDPAIADLNAGATLPDTPINVIYRSEESGTSDNFQKFLKAATKGAWETTGKAFPTATGSGANGSTGVVGQVQQIEGAITYVEAGFATEAGLGVAAIDFGSGAVELNPTTVGTALDNLTYSGEGHNLVVDSTKLFEMNQPGAYPLVLTTYEIVCSAGYDETTRNQVKDFLTVVLESQNEDLAAAGYIPVAGDYKAKLAAAVEAIG